MFFLFISFFLITRLPWQEYMVVRAGGSSSRAGDNVSPQVGQGICALHPRDPSSLPLSLCEDGSSPLHALLKHCFAGGWVKSSKYIFVFQSGHIQFSLGFMVMLAALSSD